MKFTGNKKNDRLSEESQSQQLLEKLHQQKQATKESSLLEEDEQIKHLVERLNSASGVNQTRRMRAKEKRLNRYTQFTTVFSTVVLTSIVGWFIWLSQNGVTSENFDEFMIESIDTGVSDVLGETNTVSGSLSYYLPKRFRYLYSLGVNDVIKFRDTQIVMHYNEAYNAVGADTVTYEILREENKLAGQETYYETFNEGERNGFVQVVELEENYLLTVFINGIKLSTVIDYEEAPYLAYNMLLIGKSVIGYTPLYISTEIIESDVVEEDVQQTPIIPLEQPNETPTDSLVEEDTTEGSLTETETEQTLEFDFSSEARENASTENDGQSLQENANSEQSTSNEEQSEESSEDVDSLDEPEIESEE